ncbi:MAG: response regulator receiver modulated diguanylate cyclase [Firmicutes bacterium]|nr:response regulator receiver modulated diguanylate cyclase [Bacillota bacterium]
MKVLIADDDRITRMLVKSYLNKWGYQSLEAEDGEQAWQILQDESPHLVVVDWMMPKMDGPDLCRRLRALGGADCYYYIILLTSRDSKEDIINGLNAGADDYITKPFMPQELEMRLRVGKRILELQQSLQESLEAQRYQAQHDALTGFLNHVEILKTLEQELSRAERQQRNLTLMMGDLDHFKKVNDTFGHLAGDAVLVEVARRIRNDLRIYDAVGRYGGEEFLMVLPGCTPEEAELVADRILNSISSQPVLFRDSVIPVTISLGLAFNKVNGHTDLNEIVQAADTAMYLAKQNGRNRYEIMGL